MIEISNVFEALIANALEGRDTLPDCEVLVEGLRSPIGRFWPFDYRFQAAALISLRDSGASPVKKRGGQVEIESHSLGFLALSVLVDVRIVYD